MFIENRFFSQFSVETKFIKCRNIYSYDQLIYARSDDIVKVGCPDETAYLVPESDSNNKLTKLSTITVKSFSGKINRYTGGLSFIRIVL